jgi:hypothetical protein
MQGTARALQDYVCHVKLWLIPIRKAGVSDGISAGCFPADQPSISAALRTMAAKQGKGYQSLIHELLEQAASRAV